MTQLENLLKLEENKDLLDKLNSQLYHLLNGMNIKAEEAKYENLFDKLTKMEEALNSGKTKLKKSDYSLKEYELKLKELDNDLYSGTVTNEKQLKHLTDERDRIKNLLEELETEVLENMETISTIEVEVNSIKKKVILFKEEIDLKKKQIRDNIIKLEKAKIQLNDNITSIEKTIDDNLIDSYNKIRANKGSGVVMITGGICAGCHIMVPSYQVEDIKRDKIIHCESCNRILYIPKVS